MSTADLNNAVTLFARSLGCAEAVKRFLQARHCFESDEELARSREAYNQAAKGFHEMQAAGTLTEQQITRVRTLQSKLNLHPRAIELLHAQQEMAELLQECNRQIFEVLGLDFSLIAAGCC